MLGVLKDKYSQVLEDRGVKDSVLVAAVDEEFGVDKLVAQVEKLKSEIADIRGCSSNYVGDVIRGNTAYAQRLKALHVERREMEKALRNEYDDAVRDVWLSETLDEAKTVVDKAFTEKGGDADAE